MDNNLGNFNRYTTCLENVVTTMPSFQSFSTQRANFFMNLINLNAFSLARFVRIQTAKFEDGSNQRRLLILWLKRLNPTIRASEATHANEAWTTTRVAFQLACFPSGTVV